MTTLSHENIVQYIDSIRTENTFNIIVEYAEHGAITSWLKPNGPFPGGLTLELTKGAVFSVLKGLEYLHHQGVIHRDIKGDNILIPAKGTLELKVADFGVATKQTGTNEVVGTPYWMAPEVIEQRSQHNSACDIWSVGCTVIELLTGKPPYFELSPMPAMYRIVQDDHPPLPDNISNELEDFLMACFNKRPEERKTASALLQHPWLKEMRERAAAAEAAAVEAALKQREEALAKQQKQKEQDLEIHKEKDSDDNFDFDFDSPSHAEANPVVVALPGTIMQLGKAAATPSPFATSATLPQYEGREARSKAEVTALLLRLFSLNFFIFCFQNCIDFRELFRSDSLVSLLCFLRSCFSHWYSI
jgi:serine/threonine protein kinase